MAMVRQDQDEETWLSRNIKMTPKYKKGLRILLKF